MTKFNPTQFGKYLLLDRIGSGGMAELYRGKITGAEGFEKLIAIKKILPHLTCEERLVGAFIDEAKLAAFLQHQNIIQIYDFGCMEGTYFIAMEYLFGKDLKNIVDKSKKAHHDLNLENALYIILKICTGLDYAHKLKDFHGNPLNIIHRDIGPQNIFITYEGQVKIIDFGIAKAASRNTKTLSGAIKGKVAYMSPEQAEGQNIDHRSDIFSIGILFYELVTRRRMFDGDTYQIFSQVRNAAFEPPDRVRPQLPQSIVRILNRCLEKDPVDRYQACGEIIADLETCISELSLRPTPVKLSGYLKSLFQKEAHTEELIMRDAALVSTSERQLSDYDLPEDSAVSNKTVTFFSGMFNKKAGKRTGRFMRMQWIAFFVVAGLAGGLWLIKSSALFSQHMPVKSETRSIVNENKEGATPEKPANGRGGARPDPSREMAGPDHPPVNNDLEKGRHLIDQGRFQEALALAGVMKKKYSNDEDVLNLYIDALVGSATQASSEQPEKAKKLLEEAVLLAPENGAPYFQLGLLYTRKKAYKEAVVSYRKSVALNYRLTDSLFNLGYVYAVQKDYANAEKMYQQVIEKSPAFLDEALFNLAMIQVKQGKKKLGVQNLEMAINVNPDNQMAKRYLQKLTKKKK